MHRSEGYIAFRGYKTFYKVYGDLESELTPLIVLHGGPGYPHNYLENISELSKSGRPVIFYDQLGCGKSDKPDKPALWTIQTFVEELQTLREQLLLDTVNILGQSWGGTLALEYMFTKPKGVEKLILSNPLLDTSIWVEEAKRLIHELPKWAADIMEASEKNGSTDSFEYQQAYAEFKKRHICRVEPYPKAMIESDTLSSKQVYNTMWGPNETLVSGVLQHWTSLDRIHTISTPTLFISGEYDEATPKQIEAAHRLLPGSEWKLLKNGSHITNLEVPEAYFKSVTEFLDS